MSSRRPGLGLFNLSLGALHAYLGLGLAPSRRPLFVGMVVGLVALEAVAGLALLSGIRAAARLARVASVAMIGFGALTILGLCASVGYLRGAYGALGQGLALGAVVAVVVVSHLFVVPGVWQLWRLK